MMKVGIVGIGAVGAATAMAIALRARVRELILINRNRARAKAVATDMHYGVPLSPLVKIADGDYSELASAGLAIITAGVNEKAGGPPTATIRWGGRDCLTQTRRCSRRSYRGSSRWPHRLCS
jgi:shikimate 5-dehydrogenase